MTCVMVLRGRALAAAAALSPITRDAGGAAGQVGAAGAGPSTAPIGLLGPAAQRWRALGMAQAL